MSLLSALCKIFAWVLKVFKLVVKAVAEAIKIVLDAVVDVLDTLLQAVSNSVFGGGLGKIILWGLLGYGLLAYLTDDEEERNESNQASVNQGSK